MDSVLIPCAALSAFLFYQLYKDYRTQTKCLKSLKKVQCFELDAESKKQLENSNGEIKYAAVSGRVQALSSPLVSQYVPELTGVIQEKVIVLHKLQWRPSSHTCKKGSVKREKCEEGRWESAKSDILRSFNHVPFALYGKATNLFRKEVSVEVLEPLTAKELVVPTVFDEFHCHHDSIGDTVFGIIRGEKILGIQEIERILCENETLTAVGKLIIENNKLKIKPPDDGLPYILTPLSLESLIKEMDKRTKNCKAFYVFIGCLCISVCAIIA